MPHQALPTDWSDAPTVIRDSLYDRIPMTQAALALISSGPFLRLDHIQHSQHLCQVHGIG